MDTKEELEKLLSLLQDLRQLPAEHSIQSLLDVSAGRKNEILVSRGAPCLCQPPQLQDWSLQVH